MINKCNPIKITQEIIDEVYKFNTSEELLRSGGISIEALDRAAYGFSFDDIKTITPDKLKVKWKDDYLNVLHEIEHFAKKTGLGLGTAKKTWSKKVDLSEPIEVTYENGAFYIEDGHHRYYAAKTLNKPLNVELTIKQNPIIVLGGDLSYDDFHRCVFNQVKNTSLNEETDGIPDEEFMKKLFDEGKKFFPNLKFEFTTLSGGKKLNLRAFQNYPKNKGSHSIGSFVNILTGVKIKYIAKWLSEKGFKIRYSNSTNSFYIIEPKIRVSDHKQKDEFFGTEIIVKWDSQAQDIVDEMKHKKMIEEELKSKSARGKRYLEMLRTGLFQHYDSPKGELSPIGDDDDRKRLVSKLSKEDKKNYKEWLKTDDGKESLTHFSKTNEID
jgi:hypothetical protein